MAEISKDVYLNESLMITKNRDDFLTKLGKVLGQNVHKTTTMHFRHRQFYLGPKREPNFKKNRVTRTIHGTRRTMKSVR